MAKSVKNSEGCEKESLDLHSSAERIAKGSAGLLVDLC